MSFDKLLKLIPDYIDQLIRLVSGPRRFFAGLDHEDRKTLTAGLLFLLNSAILAYVLRVPFLEETPAYWQTAISTVVLCLPTAIVLGVVAFASCRALGGQASLRAHVTIAVYLAGFSTLVFVLVVLVAKGVIKADLPEHIGVYRDYMNRHFPDRAVLATAPFDVLTQGRALTNSIWVLFAGLVLIAIWVLMAWRAYWDLNKLAGMKAGAALLLFLVVGYGVNYALSLIQLGQGLEIF